MKFLFLVTRGQSSLRCPAPIHTKFCQSALAIGSHKIGRLGKEAATAMTTKRPRIETETETSSPTRCEDQLESVVTPVKPTSPGNAPQLDEVPRLLLLDLANDNAGDVIGALERLKDLFHSDERHRMDGIEIGAPGLISMAMNKWPREFEVQASGCTCLCWLTYQPRQRRACAITARSGGMEMLIRAIKAYPDVDFINGDAFSALANIFAADEDCVEIDYAARCLVQEWQGITLIKETMTRYPDYAHLQGSCCALLCHLARDEAFHEVMNKEGMVAQVASALEHHYTDNTVKRNGNIFIKELLSD